MMIEDILAPGRALESLMRRAARGHKPSYRLLLELTPALCEAEDRLLYPELLKVRASGLERAWLMPFSGEHDQMLQLVEQLNLAPLSSRDDPMFRALQWLVVRHARAEREWLQDALARDPQPDERKLARYVDHTRPMVARAQQAIAGAGVDALSSDDARPARISLDYCV